MGSDVSTQIHPFSSIEGAVITSFVYVHPCVTETTLSGAKPFFKMCCPFFANFCSFAETPSSKAIAGTRDQVSDLDIGWPQGGTPKKQSNSKAESDGFNWRKYGRKNIKGQGKHSGRWNINT
jgi:hypothetical protein